jgi:uncharacterized membrane protein YhiD involved in acid resistance
MASSLLCLAAIALCGRVGFLDTNAMAAPATLIAANVGDQIQGAADEVRARSKDLIRDTQDKVEKTAEKMPQKLMKQTTKVALLSAKQSVTKLELRNEPQKMRLGLRKQ